MRGAEAGVGGAGGSFSFRRRLKDCVDSRRVVYSFAASFRTDKRGAPFCSWRFEMLRVFCREVLERRVYLTTTPRVQ